MDLHYAVRQLGRAPGFTATVVLTLALGLGVNTSVFLFVNDFFLRPLPVQNPDELVFLFQDDLRSQFPGDFSYPDYLDLRRTLAATDECKDPAMIAAFSDLLAFQQWPVALSHAGSGPERTWIASVSDNFFSVLGVQAVQARLFTPDEGRRPGADPIIVLSDAYWRHRFGADSAIIGRQVSVNGIALTVIGVTPPGFHGAQWSDAVSGFVPATMLPTLQPANRGVLADRGQTAFHIMGRLRRGTTLRQAQAAADAVLAGLIAAYPDEHAPARAQILPERRSRPAPKASQYTVAIVAALAAGALLVLIVSMANATNLLFARAVVREREFAVRGALGASRSQLLRPLILESVLMALAAGVVALLFAAWVDSWLQVGLSPLGDLPPKADYGADWRVPVFAGISALAVGVIASILPARGAARKDVSALLKDAARGATAARHPFRSALVAGQIALACVVLVAAGLGFRSTRALAGLDPGFRSDDVLLATYDLSLQRYVARNGLPRAMRFHAEVLDRVSRLPGVRSASLAERVPFDVDPQMAGEVAAEGEPIERRPRGQLVPVHAVTPGFRESIGMRLVAGRDLTAADNQGAPPVAIISENLATRLWPKGSALGRRLEINRGAPIEVVGIIGNSRFIFLADPKWPAVYLPLAQNFSGRLTIVVRTEGEPMALAPAVARAVHGIEPDLPLFSVRTMEQQVAQSPMGMMPMRFGATIVGMQGLLALVLAVTGIYGLVSFDTARRMREFGVRIALGATATRVTRLVAAQSVRLAATGLAVGLPAAFLVVQPLGALLYGVKPADTLVFAAVTLLVITVAIVACWMPVRRASRLNLLDVLRAD